MVGYWVELIVCDLDMANICIFQLLLSCSVMLVLCPYAQPDWFESRHVCAMCSVEGTQRHSHAAHIDFPFLDHNMLVLCTLKVIYRLLVYKKMSSSFFKLGIKLVSGTVKESSNCCVNCFENIVYRMYACIHLLYS